MFIYCKIPNDGSVSLPLWKVIVINDGEAFDFVEYTGSDSIFYINVYIYESEVPDPESSFSLANISFYTTEVTCNNGKATKAWSDADYTYENPYEY